MTIYLLTGTPGSGKSLHMARLIYWQTRRGNKCICNFEINEGMLKNEGNYEYVGNELLSPYYLQDFAQNYISERKENNQKPIQEGQIKLYIDECQLLFNARTWNEKSRKDWIKFFTLHRKLGYDIYLIAQFDYMIDKQIRSLVEYEIKHRKLNNFGKFGSIANAITFGKPITVCVYYWYQLKQRLRSETFIGGKKYYQLYDTYKIF